MTKLKFLEELRAKLAGIPTEDAEQSIAYYAEMLDDCMEDGMSEQEAVASMGSLDEIAARIVSEVPIGRLVKEKIRPKRKISTLEIVLLALGSPIWLSLLIALLVILLSVAAVLLVGVVTLWAVGASFVGCSLGAIGMGVLMFVDGFVAQGLWMVGGALTLAGLSVLMYFASLHTTIGFGKLMVMPFALIKRKLVKGEREDAQI